MVRTENHPDQNGEGGFFYRSFKRVAEVAGGVALLGIGVAATIGVLGEMLYDIDEHIVHPLDSDFE